MERFKIDDSSARERVLAFDEVKGFEGSLASEVVSEKELERVVSEIKKIRMAQPDSKYLEYAEIFADYLTYPFRVVDTFDDSEEGHAKRREWERSVDGKLNKEEQDIFEKIQIASPQIIHQGEAFDFFLTKECGEDERADYSAALDKLALIKRDYYDTKKYQTLSLEEKRIHIKALIQVIFELLSVVLEKNQEKLAVD